MKDPSAVRPSCKGKYAAYVKQIMPMNTLIAFAKARLISRLQP